MSARQHLLQSNEISVPIIGCGNQRDEMMEWWAMLRTWLTHGLVPTGGADENEKDDERAHFRTMQFS